MGERDQGEGGEKGGEVSGHEYWEVSNRAGGESYSRVADVLGCFYGCSQCETEKNESELPVQAKDVA